MGKRWGTEPKNFLITANKAKLNYGMEVEHVLQTQGNPTLISPESWESGGQSKTITLNSPPNEGAQILYYFDTNDLKKNNRVELRAFNGSSKSWEFPCSREPSSIYIAPIWQIKADVEYAKAHGYSNRETVPQRVVSWTNNGDLSVASTRSVNLAKSKVDEASTQRFIELMKLEELFNSMESPAPANQDRKNALNELLNESPNLNTYEKGLKFEQLCKKLLETMSYKVEHSGKSGDRGVDLKAIDRDPIKGLTLIVQCKHQESVAADVVIQTYGMVNSENANKGIVITTGSFTADAQKFADENAIIDLINDNKLAELIKQYLEGC